MGMFFFVCYFPFQSNVIYTCYSIIAIYDHNARSFTLFGSDPDPTILVCIYSWAPLHQMLVLQCIDLIESVIHIRNNSVISHFGSIQSGNFTYETSSNVPSLTTNTSRSNNTTDSTSHFWQSKQPDTRKSFYSRVFNWFFVLNVTGLNMENTTAGESLWILHHIATANNISGEHGGHLL